MKTCELLKALSLSNVLDTKTKLAKLKAMYRGYIEKFVCYLNSSL